jgi:probable HAF family extracellular repeat protein
MYNLNDLADLPYGWRMAEAYEINDLGQIVGYSVADGYPTYEHAFLLTPLSLLGPSAMRYDDPTSLAGTFSPRVFPVPLAEPVPEPSLVGLLVLLGACVCGRRPRRCPSTQVRTALALQRRPTTG